MDGVSYGGRAEPAAYAALLGEEGLPPDFAQLKLTFRADGELMRSFTLHYGETFPVESEPAPPPRKAFTGNGLPTTAPFSLTRRWNASIPPISRPCKAGGRGRGGPCCWPRAGLMARAA